MYKNIILIIFLPLVFLGCTNNSFDLVTNASGKNYKGEAELLIAVDGTDERKVRHIEISTDEEPEGYEIYFKSEKIGEGFIAIKIPTPSTNVRVKEYSLTGMYGCSRGKAGYGSGSKSIVKITQGKTYFLGTINTSMNTMYNEMPEELLKESKSKYNYTPHGEDFAKTSRFRSHISL
jgi:hypothetical protein